MALWGAAIALAAVPATAQERRPAETTRPAPLSLHLALGAEESYESNVPYTQFVGQDDFVSRSTAHLGVIFPIPRGTVQLGGEGGANVYRTVTALNRFTWGGNASLDQRFTRRSRIEAQARVARGFARDDPRLDAAGVLPPLTLTRSDDIDALWRHRLARRLEAQLGGGVERFRFDAPGLQNGWTARVRFRMEYSFTRRAAAGFISEFARTATSPSTTPTIGSPEIASSGRTYQIEQLGGALRLKLVRHVSLALEGGAAQFQSVLDGSAGQGASSLAFYQPTTTPTGTVTLTGSVGPHTLSALAARRIEQTYGIGAVGINDMVGLVYRLALARWVAFTATGADNHNAAPDGTVLVSGYSATAGFDFRLPAKATLRTTYSYWDEQDPLRDWRNHTVAVGLSKRFDWR